MDPFIPDGKTTWRSRLLVLIALLVLFGLPAISWFYLKEGVDFRLRIAQELTPKDTLPAELKLITSGDTLALAALEDNVVLIWTLVGVADSLANRAIMRADTLMQGFGKEERFRMVTLGPPPGLKGDLPSGKYRNWLVATSPQGKALWPDTLDATIQGLVADTSLVVRHYYDLSDRKGWSKLVEHLAVLIPQKPKPDIILKREKEK